MAEKRVQRRLAAILAADVVGYSRLMGADEAGTLARLKALRAELFDPKTAEYGGRVVKTMGDGILIEFPSAVDAVEHAIDVQQAMARRNADESGDRRIELRIGVTVGDVIVDDDDIHGDGVNVAARLEALADPGGIYLSDLVRASIRNKLDIALEDLGEQSLKNIAEPVQVYRVVLEAKSDSFAATDALFRRPAVSNSSLSESHQHARAPPAVTLAGLEIIGSEAATPHLCWVLRRGSENSHVWVVRPRMSVFRLSAAWFP